MGAAYAQFEDGGARYVAVRRRIRVALSNDANSRQPLGSEEDWGR
jgi:hypothetical protein